MPGYPSRRASYLVSSLAALTFISVPVTANAQDREECAARLSLVQDVWFQTRNSGRRPRAAICRDARLVDLAGVGLGKARQRDPLAPVRDVPTEVAPVLMGEVGCLTCHLFRAAGAPSHDVRAEDATPNGGCALEQRAVTALSGPLSDPPQLRSSHLQSYVRASPMAYDPQQRRMLTPGTILLHYRIGSTIGEGGMGVVYEGVDTRLQRPVAIKVLPLDSVTDPTRKDRFAHEAKAASALNHPNIITIHDVGSDQGVDFIVMEFVRGKTLAQLIPPGGISSTLALGYAVQIADAMAKAHDVGILHRDLKPSNIMVTDDHRIKVLDFGLAKLVDTPHSPFGDNATTLALTEKGTLVGTTAYMSPEQAEGRPLDKRSDIFSFGSIL